MMTVTITALREPQQNFYAVVRATDPLDAINRAVRRLWGRRCYWVSDSGLGLYYGQIGEPVPARLGGGTNLSTGRMKATVEPGDVRRAKGHAREVES